MSEGGGWLSRLKAGLSRSSQRLSEGITAIVGRRRLDDRALGGFEEVHLSDDLGAPLAADLAGRLRRTRFNQEVAPEEVRAALAEEIVKSLDLVERPFIAGAQKPA